MDKKTIDSYITEVLGNNETAFVKGIFKGQAILARIMLSTVNQKNLTQAQKLEAVKALSEKIVRRESEEGGALNENHD